MATELRRHIRDGMEVAFLRQIVNDINEVTGVRRSLITKRFDRKNGERPSRRAAWAKQDLIYLARMDLGIRATAIARFLGISHTYCCDAVRAVQDRISTCPAYEQRIKNIREQGRKSEKDHDQTKSEHLDEA